MSENPKQTPMRQSPYRMCLLPPMPVQPAVANAGSIGADCVCDGLSTGGGKSTLVKHMRLQLANMFFEQYEHQGGTATGQEEMPTIVMLYINLPTIANPVTELVEGALVQGFGLNERFPIALTAHHSNMNTRNGTYTASRAITFQITCMNCW